MIHVQLEQEQHALVYHFPSTPFVMAATSLAIDAPTNYNNSQQEFPLVSSSHRQWVQNIGVAPQSLAFLRQVHGNQIVEAVHPGMLGSGDGLVTSRSGVTLSVRTADCAAIFLVAEGGKGIGLLHAGWRGTKAGIIKKAVEYVAHRWQVLPQQMWVAVSPALHGCCYQVTEEFLKHFPEQYFRRQNSTWFFKFEQLLQDEIIAAGIPVERQWISPWCTACTTHPTFHSYRRDKTKQRLFNIIQFTDNSEAK